MDEERTVTLSIEWGGDSKTVHKVSRAIAAQIVMLAEVGSSASAASTTKMAAGAPTPSGNKVAPREALAKSGARTFPQKIATLGVYQQQTTNRESFTPAEIQALLKRAGETPANFSRDFANAEREFGYILENANGEYEMTDLGAEAVANGFEATLTAPRKRRRGTSRAKRAGTSVEE